MVLVRALAVGSRAAARPEARRAAATPLLLEVAGRAALVAGKGAVPLANAVSKSGGRVRLPAATGGAFRFFGASAEGPGVRDAALRSEGALRCVDLLCGDNARRGGEALLLLPATVAALRGEGALRCVLLLCGENVRRNGEVLLLLRNPAAASRCMAAAWRLKTASCGVAVEARW